MTSHIVGQRGTQEEDRVGSFSDVARPPERNLRNHARAINFFRSVIFRRVDVDIHRLQGFERNAHLNLLSTDVDQVLLTLWKAEPCLDHAERGSIDVDLVRAPFFRERLSQTDHSRFCGRVVCSADIPERSGQGRDVHHLPHDLAARFGILLRDGE